MNLKNKKILLTGGVGFLGRFVFKKLLEGGVKEDDIFIPRIKNYDLRKKEDCLEITKGKDIVIHLAAKVGGINFNKENPATTFYDNASMALNIIDASYKNNVKKFVGIGSVCEYPKFTPVPFQEAHLWDGYPEETNAPYGLAKKMMLVQSQAYRQQYGFNAIHLLLINMYGPGDNFNLDTSHVIAALIKKVADAKKEGKDYIEVWGTGKATREFLYVEDAAEAIILATEKYDKPDPVNIGSGTEISIKDLVETICRLMDFKGEIRWDISKPDGQPRRRLDVSRAEKEFGFRAQTNFEIGLQKTIEWYRSLSERSY
ncbi:MAG: GDP-fucose synthetase [Parcubacteria group bacterium CG1_02_39_15]|nr:MAG: GDP-fucose synthetase [Parcubacteria group bacterium CG1_02_39_15]